MHPRNEDRSNPFTQLIRLLGAGVCAGVLLAFIALPSIGSAGLTARNAADNFQNMDIDLTTTPPPEKTVVYDADGQQIAVFFDKYRESVRLDQISPIMQRAVVAIEDSRFYKHGALDLKGTLRAFITNMESNQVSQGGSTLTQQYVKNLLAENAKTEEEYREVTAPTVGRKVRELRYALEIEKTHTKAQILEGYLNIAYFGGGAYGVQAAAKRWFSKPASELSLGEAALLAGLTQNPTAYDPTLNPGKARERRNTVLTRMAQLGMASRADAQKEAAKPIELNESKPRGGCETSKAPFFCEYVRYEMYDILSGGKYWDESFESRREEIHNKLERGGYVIRTTLDMDKQRSMDATLRSRISPTGNKVAAEAMIEPGTGRIKAMGTSKRFGDGRGRTTMNLAADSHHGGGVGVSPGSTFKVFTLALALEKGIPIRTSIHSPNRTTVSGMTNCKGKPTGSWNVGNADPAEDGGYNLKTGTWMSVNTFYAELEKRVGLCDSVKMAERFGMKRALNLEPLEQYPTQVLGANEVDMVHLAAAYAGFAARGKYCDPIAVTEVVGADGDAIKLPKKSCRQAVDEDVADQVNEILEGVLSHGTGRGLSIGRPAAGKTGTAEGFNAAAFAGYTPNLSAAVAYWDFRGSYRHPVYGVYGATIPGPIWEESMSRALSGEPVRSFHAPSGDFGDYTSVPDVRGRSLGAAIAILRRAGFDVEVSRQPVPSDRPKGTVENTSPGPGTQVDPGTRIIIFISNGEGGRGRPNDDGGFDWPWD